MDAQPWSGENCRACGQAGDDTHFEGGMIACQGGRWACSRSCMEWLQQRDGAVLLMDRITRAIRSHRYVFDSEAELHTGLARVLEMNGIHAQHEYNLPHPPDASPPGRLDFFADGIAIEVKTKESLASVTRQLHRYAGEDCVHGIILVTTRAQMMQVPEEMSGKPLRVCLLPRRIL